jgi:hypothetical protein
MCWSREPCAETAPRLRPDTSFLTVVRDELASVATLLETEREDLLGSASLMMKELPDNGSA